MLRVLLALAALVAVAAAADPALPSIPASFTDEESDQLAIHQGLYTTKGTVSCCVAGGSCKIQTETQAGKTYSDEASKRVLFAPFGTSEQILTDYKAKKQYELNGNKCVAYCPTQGDEFPSLNPPANATVTYEGKKTVNSVECNCWKYPITLLGIVTMEVVTVCLDASDNTPVQMSTDITPFGGASIGNEVTTYETFTAGAPDPSVFANITGLASCPEGNKCNNNNQQQYRARMHMWKTWAYYEQQ